LVLVTRIAFPTQARLMAERAPRFSSVARASVSKRDTVWELAALRSKRLLPDHRPHGGVTEEALVVIHVLISGQPGVDRLAQEAS